MTFPTWLRITFAAPLLLLTGMAACRGEEAQTAGAEKADTKMGSKILMIVTSHDKLGNTNEKTGFWLEELAAPYRVFTEAGAQVDIASPKGGTPPADPRSKDEASETVKWFLGNAEAKQKLESSLNLSNVRGGYDAYFVVGGHGVMWDLANDAVASELLGSEFDRGKVVAAVCHGPGALVNVRTRDGKPLVQGRRVAGFSDEEEKAAKLESIVPFALETRLRELGGRYERGANWSSFAVRDGRLVTGQNPQSSAATARETLEALAQR